MTWSRARPSRSGFSVPWTNDRPNLEHAPSRWSYRSVSGENELKSTTFLTCPWQTASGWAYVSAVAAVCRQTDALPGERFLPARRISLQSPALAGMIKDAHELAEWVATYDELLDKRQLQHNDITVVRYRRGSTNGRNMIVSSTSELRLLGVLVRRRLDELNLQLDASESPSRRRQGKRDALSVSGDIVLRAAKRGVSAGEMIGLVLSRHLLAEEFKAAAGGGQVLTVYFLLDDYASWLSQPESRIADILALSVEEREEGVRVVISMVESKYVAADGLAKARRDSKAQLLATLGMFREALFGDPGRLDRDVWLARLADMLIDADIPPGMTGLMERARSKLREGDVEISLRGYSHVFVHTSDAGSTSASEQELLEESDGVKAWQEVFDRPDLRKLVEAYAKGAGGLEPARGWDPTSHGMGTASRSPPRACPGSPPWGSSPAARSMLRWRKLRRPRKPSRRLRPAARRKSLRHRAKPGRSRRRAAGFGPKPRARARPPTSAPRSRRAGRLQVRGQRAVRRRAGGVGPGGHQEAQDRAQQLRPAGGHPRHAPDPQWLPGAAGRLRPAARRGHREQAHAASDHARDQPRHGPAQARRDRGDGRRRQAPGRVALGAVVAPRAQSQRRRHQHVLRLGPPRDQRRAAVSEPRRGVRRALVARAAFAGGRRDRQRQVGADPGAALGHRRDQLRRSWRRSS